MMSKALDTLFETRGGSCGKDVSRVLIAKVPAIHELRMLPSFYLSSDKPPHESDFHWATLKCRSLIFNDSFNGLLAAPSKVRPNYIDIVVDVGSHNDPQFKAYLKSLNLHFGLAEDLNLADYERCLQYTVLARLAPLWNPVGAYIIPGRDFLTESKPIDALKLSFVINARSVRPPDVDRCVRDFQRQLLEHRQPKERNQTLQRMANGEFDVLEYNLHLVMWPVRVKLWPMLCEHIVAEPISQDCTRRITNFSTVCVMPSMKEAEVCFLNTRLPENSVFSTYNEVKKYWKNTHGYRLPDDQNHPEQQSAVLYMTVRFGRRLPALTYPLACLQARPPTLLRVRNETHVLAAFLGDLLARMPRICGLPFGAEASVGVAVQRLIKETIFTGESHLLDIPVQRFTQFNAQCLGKTKSDETEPCVGDSALVHKFVPASFMSFTSNDTDDNDDYNKESNSSLKFRPIFTGRKKEADNQQEGGDNGVDVGMELPAAMNCNYDVIKVSQRAGPKFTPIFLPRQRPTLVKPPPPLPITALTSSASSQVSSTTGKSYQQVQHFNSKDMTAFQPVPSKQPSCLSSSSSYLQNVRESPIQRLSNQQKFMPLFLPRSSSKPSLKTTTPILLTSQRTNTQPVQFSNSANSKAPLFFAHQQENRTTVSSSSDLCELDDNHDQQHHHHHHHRYHQPHQSSSNRLMSSAVFKQPAVKCIEEVHGGTTAAALVSLSSSSSSSLSIRKPRSRPQVQSHIDVALQATAPDGLSRVNTATLIDFLRKRNIPCRVKDKKAELVAKVMQHLSSAEPMMME